MVSTLPDQKRQAIGEKLADMRALQNLLIANEEQFLGETNDKEILERFTKILEDDKKNLGIIETVIIQYGIQCDPADDVKEMIQKTQRAMKGSEMSFYEKVFKNELLKHAQVVSGLVIHKAAQVVGTDVQAAIGPLTAVNFENRAHQEQLQGMLEFLGTRELTGQDADDGIWARVQDTIAALGGIVGSAIKQGSDKSDMNIQDIIRLDHQKANILIADIEKSDDAAKIKEYFTQLSADLIVHSKAEEEVVYPAVRPFYGEENTQELYDEQAELAAVLEQMKTLSPTSPEFKSHLGQVKEMLRDHTTQEENTMFAAIRNNCSSEQSEKLATEFKKAKQSLQVKEKAANK